MGLAQHRAPRLPVRNAVAQLFTESIAVHMHSVGQLGNDERIDNSGSLHYVSVRKRKAESQTKADYGTLQDLFYTGAPPSATATYTKFEVGEEGEGEEIIEEDVVEGGSISAAIFGIVKGTVGPAILYLPHGFQMSGYLVAIPAMLFATYMFIYNAYRLLECWKVESDRNHQMAAKLEEIRAILPQTATDNQQLQASGDGSQQFTPTLLTYPELARRAFGRWSFLVELGIALMQFGVCLTYLIFVPQNLHECCLAVTGLHVPKMYFLAIMLAIEIPLSWIADIRKLTPTNVVATLLIAFGLCSVLGLALDRGCTFNSSTGQYIFRTNLSDMPAITNAWFIFIGTSFFMMEGSMTLIVPLQEAVYSQEDRKKFPRINAICTMGIVLFYIFFSMVCAAAFGNHIETAMTASLRGVLATIVQAAYSVAVILTFPLQAFPAMQVTCNALMGSASGPDNKSVCNGLTYGVKRSIVATLVILSLGVIAVVSIDFLGNVVSILGSLFGIPLALVFPPLMHNKLVKDSARRLQNNVVVGVGIFAMGAASFATIVSWDEGAEGR